MRWRSTMGKDKDASSRMEEKNMGGLASILWEDERESRRERDDGVEGERGSSGGLEGHK